MTYVIGFLDNKELKKSFEEVIVPSVVYDTRGVAYIVLEVLEDRAYVKPVLHIPTLNFEGLFAKSVDVEDNDV